VGPRNAAVSTEGARGLARVGEAEMDIVRRVEPEARVPVFGVVPREEISGKCTRAMLGRSKAVGKSGRYLSVLNWASDVWVVVGHLRSELRFRHAKIGEEDARRASRSSRSRVGMEGDVAPENPLPSQQAVMRSLGEAPRIPRTHHSPHHVATEHVEHDYSLVRRTRRRAFEPRDIPAPELVRARRE